MRLFVLDDVEGRHLLIADRYPAWERVQAIVALPSERRPLEAIVHSHNPNGAERMRDVLLDAGIKCKWVPFSGLRGG